jgi:hypothetical protein
MEKLVVNRCWAVINFLLTLGVIVVNIMANILPLNGVNTGVVSDMLPNLFVPAGLTFSIWGVIYLALLGYGLYGLYQAFSVKTAEQSAWVRRSGPAYLLASIANMAWIFAWHWRLIGLSLVLMLTILAALIWWYAVSRAYSKLLVRGPVSLYLGWISVATVANVTAYLVSIGFAGGPWELSITVAILLVVLIIASLMIWRETDLLYTLVIIWAMVGIAIKRLGPAEHRLPELAWVALGIGFVLMVLYLLRLKKNIGKVSPGEKGKVQGAR